MDNKYWVKRSEETLLDNEKSVLQYEKELKKAYEATARRIKTEIQAFYHKYANDNKIDLATAKQKLNAIQLKDFHTQMQDYLDEVDRLGLDPKYQRHLDNLSKKAYISKLQEIQTIIQHHIEVLSKRQEEQLTQELKKDYVNGYNQTMYTLQSGLGFGVSFTAVGSDRVEKAIKTKWKEEHFSDRIWNNKKALIEQLNTLIPQEFVRGRGSRQLAQDLVDKLNIDYNSAKRLARTEMNYISNQATLDSYKDSRVVQQYKYLATLDNRTSMICRELDGKVFNVSDAQAGINLPPMHPYCRSTTVPYFEDNDLPDLGRIARRVDGKTYIVPSDMTYKQWAEKYGGDT